MNSVKRNSERIFKELINSHFTEKQALELGRLMKEDTTREVPLFSFTAKDKRQIETEFPKENTFVSKIDQTILFAREKLSNKNYLKFLLSVGKYELNEGDGNHSLEIFEMLINASRGEKDGLVYRAEANLMIADVYRKRTKWAISLKYLGTSKDIFQKLNDENGLAKCSNMLGTLYGEIGNFRKSKSFFEESLDLTTRTKNNEFRGKVEINLGIINGIFGDYQKSRDYFTKALKYFEKTGDKKRKAEIYNNLGMMDYSASNFELSLDEFNRSIDICLGINYFQLLGISFLGKAITFLKLKNLPLAIVFSDKALTVCNKSGDRLSVADIYKVKGIIEREYGRYKESEMLLKTSLMMNIQLGNKLNEAETSVELGKLFKLLNENKKSAEMFRNAISYYKDQGGEEKLREIISYLNN